MKLRNLCNVVFLPPVQAAIIIIIILNSLTLGLDTIKDLSYETKQFLAYFDTFVLYIYVLELVLKHIALGFKFWKNGWNIFDFIIVAMSFIPAGSSLSVLRGLRILRILRLFTSIKPLRIIVLGLMKSIPSIAWLLLMLLINFYLFAVIGTNFFGEKFPVFFGSIGKSSFTLFQVMTLESWSMSVARPIIAEFEYAFIYFVVFILINTFEMLNLFVGIIVSAMSSSYSEDNKDSSDKEKHNGRECSTEDNLQKSIQDLKKQLDCFKNSLSKIESELKTNSAK